MSYLSLWSCERITQAGVKEEDLTTGTGYLRNKGWTVKMSLEERAGGIAALKALQAFTRKLDEQQGKKAFQDFQMLICEFWSRLAERD